MIYLHVLLQSVREVNLPYLLYLHSPLTQSYFLGGMKDHTIISKQRNPNANAKE